MSEYVLMHHGVKGMHWGIRRYQNKDGTLTSAGKKRYDTDINGAKQKVNDAKNAEKEAKKAYNKATHNGYVYNAAATKKLNKAVQNTQWAKEDLSSERVKEKLNSEQTKSKHRLELESHYFSKGMTEEEAAVAAYKRDRTEKIIAATAAVGITAATAYVAYKHYDKTVDKLIKSDTILSRVDKDGTSSVHDAFYATMDKSKIDKAKYVGNLGSRNNRLGFDTFQKSIQVKDGLNVASEKSAVKALSELIKSDSSYAKELESTLRDTYNNANILNTTEKQRNALKKGLNSLSKGKIDSKVYEALNLQLADHSSVATKQFYKHMISKGYDAVMDVNDKKLSGYMARTPMIVFNSSKTAVDNVRKVGEQEIAKAKAIGMMDIALKTYAPSLAGIGIGTGVGITAVKKSQSQKNDSIVSTYRKKHPNTTLSYTEIVRNYYNK